MDKLNENEHHEDLIGSSYNLHIKLKWNPSSKSVRYWNGKIDLNTNGLHDMNLYTHRPILWPLSLDKILRLFILQCAGAVGEYFIYTYP